MSLILKSLIAISAASVVSVGRGIEAEQAISAAESPTAVMRERVLFFMENLLLIKLSLLYIIFA
jgi:hypothetical protein